MENDLATGPVELNVLVDDEHVPVIEEVAAALGQAGLRLGETLAAAGVITGSVEDPALLDAVREVQGVAGVEVTRSFQLPPPDAPVQ